MGPKRTLMHVIADVHNHVQTSQTTCIQSFSWIYSFLVVQDSMKITHINKMRVCMQIMRDQITYF